MTLANFTFVSRDGSSPTDISVAPTEIGFLQASVDMPELGQIKCPRCAGSGKKFGGQCFRCKGACYVDAPQTPAAPAAQPAPQMTERDKLEKISQFTRDHKKMVEYCGLIQNDFTFGCIRKLMETGSMTGPQMAAIQRDLDRRAVATRKAANAAQPAAQPTQAPALDLAGLPAGCYAVPGGDTRLKVQVDKPAAGKRYHNWIFVKDAAVYGSGREYGRQTPGGRYVGAIVEELRVIASDPKAAAIAYGKLTGTCAMCGKRLENEESVARGIGPSCAKKRGWA